jgi:hypothetical protein
MREPEAGKTQAAAHFDIRVEEEVEPVEYMELDRRQAAAVRRRMRKTCFQTEPVVRN